MSISDGDAINQLSKYCMECPDFGRFVLDIGSIEEMTEESDLVGSINLHPCTRLKEFFQTLEMTYLSKSIIECSDISFKLDEMFGYISEQVIHGNHDEVAIKKIIKIEFNSRNTLSVLAGLSNRHILSEVQKRANAYEALQ